jgi:hypothetical protein
MPQPIEEIDTGFGNNRQHNSHSRLFDVCVRKIRDFYDYD